MESIQADTVEHLYFAEKKEHSPGFFFVDEDEKVLEFCQKAKMPFEE